MKPFIRLVLPFFVFMLLVQSCKKNNDSTTVSYKVKAINKSSAVARLAGGIINWTSGSGYVREIEFEAEKDSSEVDFKSIVSRRIDLFATLSDLGSITLPPSIYKEIEIEINFESVLPDTAFVLNGSFTNSSSGITPVVFIISDPVKIESEANNITISGSNNYTAITSLDFSLLTNGITENMLNNATRTNGIIVISKTENSNLYNIIINNMDDMDSVDLED